jgi:catechol 2,3-dioxygenase-like lactoylglutathione lyase family enzyme
MTGRQRTGTLLLMCVSCVLVTVATVGVLMASERSKDRPRKKARAERQAAQANRVRLEHVGLNVADPIKAAQWYVDNLGMRVLREGPAPINARFLGDADGNMMLEIYHNPPEAVPNYAAMDPLLLHVAFMVEDVEAMRGKLIAAGATAVGEVTTTPAGDKLAMLRDPWGLAIQFVRRADPMLSFR